MTNQQNENGIVLVEEDSRLKALTYSRLPSDFYFAGKLYRAKQETLGEYDYLRNREGELIGFCINITPRERKLLSSLAMKCGQVQIGEHQVRFILGSGTAKEEGVQIPTTIYRTDEGEMLIAFYQWEDLGRLGFSLRIGE